MDAAYHRVFKGVLNGITSVSLAKAQGRLVKINLLYSNKTSFTTGVGEVPRVSVWPHPYTFDDITIYDFVTEGIKVTVGKDQKKKVDGMEAAIRRKLLVIFSLLGLLHAQHNAEKSVTVCDDFRAVIDHLKGEKSLAFQKLLVSDAPKHRISDNEPHFLSDMGREYIKGAIFLNVNDPVATPQDVAPVSGPAVAQPDINIDARSVAVWSGDDDNAPTMIQVPHYICKALEQVMGGSDGMIRQHEDK
ncbi:unnamed protein product [Sphacelaria rigidula]